MKSEAKLLNLGADVRSIRHIRTGEMILERNRDEPARMSTTRRLESGSDPTGQKPYHGTALKAVRGVGDHRIRLAMERPCRDTGGHGSAISGGR